MSRQTSPWIHAIGLLGLLLLLAGSAIGLLQAPPERHMGDVSRILYVHVPTAWSCMAFYFFAFVSSILLLWTSRPRFDALQTGFIETGVVLNVLLLATGMFFARPTWGVWWTWDVRLTTSLISLVLFAGILGLRSFVDDPARRGAWTAVASIVAFVDVPIIYFCVRWWRSLHQVQSSPETVDAAMVLPWRMNAIAVFLIALWCALARSRLEERRFEREQVAPPEPLATIKPPVSGVAPATPAKQ